jgi:outer membrane protein assembly factor BamB
MKTFFTVGFVLLALTEGIHTSLHAADWPVWRGPARDGMTKETDWKLTANPKVLWEAEVGQGYAGFTVSAGRVYTTGHANGEDTLYCFDADTGKPIWKKAYPAELGDKYYDGGTSATPVVNGDQVYHLSRWGDAMCLDAASGKVCWQKNVAKETGCEGPEWGFAGAPLVLGKRVFLNVGETGLCVDKSSGDILWKSGTQASGYSTPYPLAGGETLIFGAASAYTAVSAQNGAVLWSHPWKTRYGVNAADPIPVSADQFYVSCGYNHGGTVFQVQGDKTQTIWENKVLRTHFNTALRFGDYLYGCDGDHNSRASFKCQKISDGTEAWSEPSTGFCSALGCVDGRMLVLTSKGELIEAKAEPNQFTEITRAQVLSGTCWTTPILANQKLYLRNSTGHISCLQLAAAP